MTILYRAHYVTRAVETALMEAKIPYVIYSGVQFYQREEIKDALSYLRMIAYQDDLSFRRIINKPKRSLGKRRMAYLEEYAGHQGCSLSGPEGLSGGTAVPRDRCRAFSEAA